MIWIISDTHFFHKNIIKYCSRPYYDEYEMNYDMVKRWNSTVSEKDFVFHLGDVVFGAKVEEIEVKNLLQKLNGEKYLIEGNHDKYDRQFYLDCGFNDVCDFYVYNKYFLCHYPLKIDDRMNRGMIERIKRMKRQFENSKCEFVFHGHNHTEIIPLADGIPHYNVSCDLSNYYPINFEEAIKDKEWQSKSQTSSIMIEHVKTKGENMISEGVLKIKKLSEDAIIPSYAKPGDAGMDLYSIEDAEISPGRRQIIKTGIAIELPENMEAQIRPRSGLAVKSGLTVLNSPGTIDTGFRGEIGVIIVNLGEKKVFISKGDRIAQMVINKFERMKIEEVEDISETERGKNGFGSTGN